MVPAEFSATNRAFEEKVVAGRDFGALDGIYTRHARILPPGAPMVSGREAIKTFWAQALPALGVTAGRLVTIDLTITGDTAQEVGRAELHVGGAPAPVALKYVVLWKREDDAWRWDVDIWNADG